jgi:hypothetical protein
MINPMKIYQLTFTVLLLATIGFACSDNSTEPIINIDTNPGLASDYFPLKTGNWWHYYSPLGSNNYRRIIGDTLRHQNGTLLFKLTDSFSAQVPYAIGYYYAVVDSGILCFDYAVDSIFVNNQWIQQRGRKSPLLMNPIATGHSWTYLSSGSIETFQIISIGSLDIWNARWPIVVTVVRNSSTQIDTSWYIKNIGLARIHEYDTYGVDVVRSFTELDSCNIK